jgi:hypothetical protein
MRNREGQQGRERAMLAITEQEIRATEFDAGYACGNLEQEPVPPQKPELQPIYDLGYQLGSKHRLERHALRDQAKESH